MKFYFVTLLSLFLFSCGGETKETATDGDTSVDSDVSEKIDTTTTTDEETRDTESLDDEKRDADTFDTEISDSYDNDKINDDDIENPEHIIEDKISGTWAVKVEYNAITNAPMIGDVGSSSQRYIKMKISDNQGDGVSISQTICHIDSQAGTGEGDSGLAKGTSYFADSFLTAFHFWHPANLKANAPDAFVKIEDGTPHFYENTSWELRGMQKMNNILTDLMPTDKSDTRIMDQDGDGHPGVTVTFEGIMNGDLYFVERLSRSSIGVISPDYNRIAGHIIWTDEQFTVDATSSTLAAQKITTPDNEKSGYIFVRIADEKSCEDIYNEKESLF